MLLYEVFEKNYDLQTILSICPGWLDFCVQVLVFTFSVVMNRECGSHNVKIIDF